MKVRVSATIEEKNKKYLDKSRNFELRLNGKKSQGTICDLPLI